MSWKVHETDEVFAALRGLCSNSYRMYDPYEHRSYFDHDCDVYECAVEDAADEYTRLLKHCEKQRDELAGMKDPDRKERIDRMKWELSREEGQAMDNIDGGTEAETIRIGEKDNLSITGELRKWANTWRHVHISKDGTWIMSPAGMYIDDIPTVEELILAMADRIDERHEQTRRNLTDALHQQEEATHKLSEKSALLPVDADGVPIHTRDRLEGNGLTIIVDEICFVGDHCEIRDDHGFRYCNPRMFKHVQPDTWERIIEDATAEDLLYSHAELVERCRRLVGE